MFLYFPVEQLLFSPSLGCYRSFGLAAVLDAPQGKTLPCAGAGCFHTGIFCRGAGQAVHRRTA